MTRSTRWPIPVWPGRCSTWRWRTTSISSTTAAATARARPATWSSRKARTTSPRCSRTRRTAWTRRRGSPSIRASAARPWYAATWWWRSPNDEVAGRRGHRDRAEREVSRHRSAHGAVHRPPPVGHGASRLQRRSQSLHRGCSREDPDGVARGVPEPMISSGRGWQGVFDHEVGVGGRAAPSHRRARAVGSEGTGLTPPPTPDHQPHRSASAGTPRSPGLLPGDDLVRGEDLLEELLVGDVVGDAVNTDARGQRRSGGAVEERHGDLVAGLDLAGDGRQRHRRVVSLEQVQDGGGHQKTMERRACPTSSVIWSRVTTTTGCPSVFQSGSLGTAVSSTWDGIPSCLSVLRNLAISSPSISSSVSPSSRWTAPSVRTKVTAFSPDTTPIPMRIASNARWVTRGSHEMSTRTGCSSDTRPARPDKLIQGDEAIGPVDDVRQHDQAAVGEVGRVLQRDPTLLASVGAYEELGAAPGQPADAGVVERPDAVVDEVKVQAGASVQGRLGQPHRGPEVRMIGSGGQQDAEFFSGEIHRWSSLAPGVEESNR